MHYAAPACHDRPLVSWRAGARVPTTLALFGMQVVNDRASVVLDWVCARLDAGQATRGAFVNAHCVNVAARDGGYRTALETADILLPDGSGIALAARLAGTRLVENLNGTDLVPALCRRLAPAGHSVFLMGGRPGVAEQAGRALQQACPGLAIAGTHHGYFGAEDEDAVVRAINASGASVLLVALGVPMQDAWLARLAGRLLPALALGVGGLFDFLSGRIPRAPAALRASGLEWTYRLYQEPARMWRRYMIGNPAFVGRAAAAALGQRLPGAGPVLKRAIDVAGSGAALLLLAPLLLLAAALVRLTSPGPALLRQTRVGEDGVPFTMFKLRSMYIDAEARRAALAAANQHGAAGLTFKLKRDPRVTPVGRLLRKSSVDELPQLWNVLTGAMSLVGPRPQLPGEVARYEPRHFPRLAGKPGLTCLWQIGGRADVAFEAQCQLDLRYLQTRSLATDLRILLLTVPAVLSARGAY